MRPKKHLGQHFLRDQTAINGLLERIRPQAKDDFLELAAGDGALTGPLLYAGSRVLAIELDSQTARRLQQRWRNPRLQVWRTDLLSAQWQLPADKGMRRRLVGNLPYNISSLCLARAMQEVAYWHDCHFLVQLEMAQRLTAEPGGEHWGRLGVLAQCTVDSRLLMTVEPDAFWPPPKVRSALVRLRPLRTPRLREELLPGVLYAARHLFSMRRKTLRAALKALRNNGIITAEDLAALDMDDSIRAGEVDLAALEKIAARLQLPTPGVSDKQLI